MTKSAIEHSSGRLFEPALGDDLRTDLENADYLRLVDGLLDLPEFGQLKSQAEAVAFALSDQFGDLSSPALPNASDTPGRRDAGFLFRGLPQVLEARTLKRAHYYLSRARKALVETRTNNVNDVDLNRWHDYPQLITDSLWTISKRDASGSHSAGYWGNFIPQIPNQLIQRFTSAGDWVVDPFCGSGTTLIEAQRLGRNALGVELQSEVVELARSILAKESDDTGVQIEVLEGDSTKFDLLAALKERGSEGASLALLHPPYHDIIPFSDRPDDLSNAPTEEAFLELMSQVLGDVFSALLPEGHVGIVIGDKYRDGEWVPLGFELMDVAREQGFSLKSVIVKNFEATTAKRGQESLWRYRALVGGFYVFKHEYIFLMKK